MIRTIDGTDYIAKSEVLRIIDEHLSIAREYGKRTPIPDAERERWVSRALALSYLRYCLTNKEEQ